MFHFHKLKVKMITFLYMIYESSKIYLIFDFLDE
jgi:hypothetical protein